MTHVRRRAQQWSPGWSATLVPIDEDALVSSAKSRTYAGLWLKEPGDFLFDAMPRARAYLRRFPPPPPPEIASHAEFPTTSRLKRT